MPGDRETDRFGFGDVTAGSVVSSSVLGPPADADRALARARAVAADGRAAMIAVAEHAAEIGLDSAPALAAAAGIAFRPRPAPGQALVRPAPAGLPSRQGIARPSAATPLTRSSTAVRRTPPPLAGPTPVQIGSGTRSSRQVVRSSGQAVRSSGEVVRSTGQVARSSGGVAPSTGTGPQPPDRRLRALTVLVILAVAAYLLVRIAST